MGNNNSWGQAWDQTEQLIVTFVDGQRVRFTLGVCNEYAMGQYRAYLRQAQRFIDEKYSVMVDGKPVKPGSLKTDAQIDALDDEQRALYDLGDITLDLLNKWAAIRASLRCVELDIAAPPAEPEPAVVPDDIGEDEEADGDKDAGEIVPLAAVPAEHQAQWKEVALPPNWLAPSQFIYSVPTGVVSALYMRVNGLNPGVFSMWAAGTKKKIVRISAA